MNWEETERRTEELKAMPVGKVMAYAYLDFIRDIADEDCEIATFRERELWERILETMAGFVAAWTAAGGSEFPEFRDWVRELGELANIALRTNQIDFPRWV